VNTAAPESTVVILKRGAGQGLRTFWILMRVMIPVYVGIALLSRTPVLPAIAEFFQPAMGIWHLPGDAALAMVLGHFVNLYAALAVIAAGHWDPTAVSVAAIILGISHSHIMESAIFRLMRMPFGVLATIRVTAGWGLGWIVAALMSH
jgi:hypothetical protein